MAVALSVLIKWFKFNNIHVVFKLTLNTNYKLKSMIQIHHSYRIEFCLNKTLFE